MQYSKYGRSNWKDDFQCTDTSNLVIKRIYIFSENVLPRKMEKAMTMESDSRKNLNKKLADIESTYVM